MDKFKPKSKKFPEEVAESIACAQEVDFSLWNSPIQLIETVPRTTYEDGIFNAVKEVGVMVDKERLLMVLQNDRASYADGYRAGFEAAQPKWISVEEGLPGDPLDGVGDVVELLIDKGDAKEVLPGYYDHDEKDWVIYFGDILGGYRRKTFPWWRVIKWSPFPEPPKEEA